MGAFDDMIPEFVAESKDLLPEVEQGLLALESDPESVDPETINTIFRAMHSIKGGASFVGLTQLEHLAHKMEDLLNLVRNGDMTPTPEVVAELLNSLDVVSEMLEEVETSNDYDIDERMAALQAIIDGQAAPQAAEAIATPAVSSKDWLSGFTTSAYNLEKRFNQGFVYFLEYDLLAAEKQGFTPLKLIKEIISLGEVIDADVTATAAADAPLDAKTLTLRMLFFSVMEEELLQIGLNPPPAVVTVLSPSDFEPGPAEEPAPAAPAAEEEAPAMAAAAPETTEPPAPPAAAEAPPAPPLHEPPQDTGAAGREKAPAVEDASGPEWAQAGEYLTFFLAEEEYAVETARVQEIISMQHIARLPRTPSYVKGVINLRGMVVPVVCLREKLGFEPATYDKYTVIIVVQTGEKTTGLIVDSVSDVNELSEDNLQPPPDFARKVSSRFIKGLGKLEDRFLILLDLTALLDKSELAPIN